jgi:hypothetical protein
MRWWEILASFQRNLDILSGQHPECIEDIILIHSDLITVGQLIHISPRVNGNGASWKKIITLAEAQSSVFCKHLEGKALFTSMLFLYAVTHRELSDSLQPKPQEEEPTEQRAEAT